MEVLVMVDGNSLPKIVKTTEQVYRPPKLSKLTTRIPLFSIPDVLLSLHILIIHDTEGFKTTIAIATQKEMASILTVLIRGAEILCNTSLRNASMTLGIVHGIHTHLNLLRVKGSSTSRLGSSSPVYLALRSIDYLKAERRNSRFTSHWHDHSNRGICSAKKSTSWMKA